MCVCVLANVLAKVWCFTLVPLWRLQKRHVCILFLVPGAADGPHCCLAILMPGTEGCGRLVKIGR